MAQINPDLLTLEGPSFLAKTLDNGIGLYIHIPFCQSKCIYCDFNDDNAFKEFLKKIKSMNFDALVNNAGIARDNLLMRMKEEDFNQVIKVNLNSV